MEERKWVCVYKDACGSLMLLGGRRGYLRFTPGLQLVFVVAEPFVIEAYIFCQGADLLEPHFLCEWALYAVALMNNFPLEKKQRRGRETWTVVLRAVTPLIWNRKEGLLRIISSSGGCHYRTVWNVYLQEMTAVKRCVWGSCLMYPLLWALSPGWLISEGTENTN